ncbi:MAG: L-threonylcarbamoyladenylate synthase [Solirubrobacterales bacterium]|nr:L-threonylcarbamoyladenylate synthase [Solirubrobacterales bacterium]
MAPLTPADAETFSRCMSVEGVAVFPADTVYGLACEPESKEGVRRLYALKRRDRDQPAAVMFFQPSLALAALPELGSRTREAMLALLPGPVTLLLPNPAGRYPLACGSRPDVLGLRVPALPPELAALEAVRWPVLQSSANPAGAPAPRRLADLDRGIGEAVDLVLDGGELPGVSSTIVDLTAYEEAGVWTIARAGAFSADAVAAVL